MLAAEDGSQVAGDIALTLLAKMEAGPPTETTSGREVTMTQHSDVHRQRGHGMKYERPSCKLEREGEGQETAT